VSSGVPKPTIGAHKMSLIFCNLNMKTSFVYVILLELLVRGPQRRGALKSAGPCAAAHFAHALRRPCPLQRSEFGIREF
jgi:hypothetical protein